MEESRLATFYAARQQSDSLADPPDAPEIMSVERQLEERLSRIREGESEHASEIECLLFWIDGKRYCAELTSLREALPAIPNVTPLPFSPVWLLGLFPLRTDLIALIDPRALLREGIRVETARGQSASLHGKQALLVGESGQLIAFVVDRIGDIVSFPDPFSPAPDEAMAKHEVSARYVKGIYSHESEGFELVLALNVISLYEDVIGKLEEWSRDA
jgi:chemotaxis signal transduction protein